MNRLLAVYALALVLAYRLGTQALKLAAQKQKARGK
jgi:hypothetical protein